ncbi:hypothetical protein D9619_004484 [Psilocybe cf. subviscida]|uniref:Uncharacterized protein n=1 Tax=Psilocybe cf. subviscida TaxID=2480587 RepID=A0A8H5BS30_9AGAR|nr:hypothetical protein D9619_004484 [Psilocybe cf. subviscida]
MHSGASTKTPAFPLPQEIIDTVIDNFALPLVTHTKDHPLHRSHLASLKACSLVCHTFTPRSQTHIFSMLVFGIKVVYANKQSDAERRVGLLDLLKTKPHITQNVRGISLDWEARTGSTAMWHIDDMNLFAHIHTLCLNITSLCVNGGVETRDIPLPLFQPVPIARFKTITFIRFDNVAVDISTFALYPGLCNLCLSNVNFIGVSPTSATNASHSSRLILHSLQFDWTNEDSINSLAVIVEGAGHLPVLDLSQLRSFGHAQHALTDQMVHLQDLSRILRRCVSLEKLDLRGSWLPILLRRLDKDSTIFRLSQLPKLAELVTNAMIIEFHKDSWEIEHNPLTDSPFLDVINLIDTISVENCLSKLELKFEFMSHAREPSIANISATVNWQQLASQFIRIANGKALEVELVIVWIIARVIDAGTHDAHGRDIILSDERHRVSRILRSTFDEDLHTEMQSLRSCQWVKINVVYDVC